MLQDVRLCAHKRSFPNIKNEAQKPYLSRIVDITSFGAMLEYTVTMIV